MYEKIYVCVLNMTDKSKKLLRLTIVCIVSTEHSVIYHQRSTKEDVDPGGKESVEDNQLNLETRSLLTVFKLKNLKGRLIRPNHSTPSWSNITRQKKSRIDKKRMIGKIELMSEKLREVQSATAEILLKDLSHARRTPRNDKSNGKSNRTHRRHQTIITTTPSRWTVTKK